jgi:DNA-directed RNA polymerase specialized sigma subunit
MRDSQTQSRQTKAIPFISTSGGLMESSSESHNNCPQKRPPLTFEQQDLAKRYVPMARSLAKPLKAAWPLEREEFDSAAMVALVEAAQSFDPTRNVKFGTFARFRIWGALRDVQRGLITSGFYRDLENTRLSRLLPRKSSSMER